MEKIKLELSLAEINQILDALSNRPYKEVYSLIDNIRAQASSQMENRLANGQKNKTT